jgi:hypothetical protein
MQRLAVIAGALVLGVAALALRGRGAAAVLPPGDVPALAAALRALYDAPGHPGERWRRGSPRVQLPDGRSAPREAAYRDDPRFVPAASSLLRTAGDEAALGAWLLGSVAPAAQEEAAKALAPALLHRDPLAAVEAARALGRVGGPESVGALRAAMGPKAGGDPAESAALHEAAGWAIERIRERHPAVAPPPATAPRLAAGFHRGVNWWFEAEEHDGGLASFRELRSLGLDWVSVHSWDPLQSGVHDPDFTPQPGRWGIPDLPALVKNAHAAGLKVMVKPHLEMGHFRPRPEDIAVLRGPDAAAREKVRERLRAEREAQGWHNDIEMKTEADWRTWFRNYEEYVTGYARRAQEAGADMFCVGRELDRSVLRREQDWRRVIARVREVFRGPLVYSANFDSYEALEFWDALDYIGVSAYFSLSADEDPSLDALVAGWERALPPLEARARRFGKPVIFTEVGFASVAGAARTPWRPPDGAPRPWLQARCYEATLRVAAARPWIQGTFWWLWEGVEQPPFRDDSYTLKGKPAGFLLRGWYAAPR